MSNREIAERIIELPHEIEYLGDFSGGKLMRANFEFGLKIMFDIPYGNEYDKYLVEKITNSIVGNNVSVKDELFQIPKHIMIQPKVYDLNPL